MKKIRFDYPVETHFSCVSDTYGTQFSEYIKNNPSVDLTSRVLPVIKPEDFSGNTITDKVVAANDFIINAGGGFELYFGDTSVYLIDKAIVLPNNTTVRMDNCTIQMADNTVDNIFRSANIEINPSAPRGFAKNKTSMDSCNNIRIIGENGASLLMCDSASSSNYGVTNTGWRGHTILLAGVSNFEIAGFTINKNIAWGICLSGCGFGRVHDLIFNTSRENGDGIDVEFGSHDIEIYNISGYTYDDTIAVSNSGPTRLLLRPVELNRPTCPFDYGWRKFGEETHNIRIYNVNTVTTCHNVIFICGDYGIHNVSVSDVSDKNGASSGSIATVKIYGGQYDGNYRHGLIHNCSISNVESNNPSTAAIFLAQGIIENGIINNVKVASGKTLLNDQSGATWADYNFTITNTGTITE